MRPRRPQDEEDERHPKAERADLLLPDEPPEACHRACCDGPLLLEGGHRHLLLPEAHARCHSLAAPTVTLGSMRK